MLVTLIPTSTPLRSTATGVKRLVLLVSPNWPDSLFPQAATVPSAHSARLWPPPAETATTVLPASTPLRSTSTGAELLLVVLLPNWPELFTPQATTVPSEHKARL